MTHTHRKKLIEVALPLEAINVASAREKSIRHGHPSTLHLWWARRPLAAARAVIFTSLVDDPDDPDALPAFVEACKKLPKGKNVEANGDTPRMRLFDFIERLVTWESTTNEDVLNTARELIQIATEGNPPPLLDPFAGGGSIPLEAQRLGLEAHASDLNPVAVMINKAQIEIPPRFANMPPVNPRDRKGLLALTPNPSPKMREGKHPHPESLPQDEGGFDKWDISPELERKMQALARELRKNPTEAEEILWQAIRKKQLDGRKFRRQVAIGAFVVDFYCSSERLAVEVDGPIHEAQQEADQLRQELIESLGIRFVRLTNAEIQANLESAISKIRNAFNSPSLPVGEGVGGWGHPSLPVGEGAGGWGHTSPTVGEGPGVRGDSTWRGAAGLAADVRYYGEWMREKAWERIGHLYPTHNGETVIAWLWARTVKSPNPAVDAHVPLVRSFILSKKKGRECWAKPIVTPTLDPSPKMREGLNSPSLPVGEGAGGWGNTTHTVRFEVTKGLPPKDGDGTVNRRGAVCIISGEPITRDYIKAEAQAGRMGAILMGIVTEGTKGRSYYSPTKEHLTTAGEAQPEWAPHGEMAYDPRNIWVKEYGMTDFADLFTPRQLVALTTFSDLVAEARHQAQLDAINAGLPDDGIPLRDGGRGALAYAEAVSVYLAFGVSRGSDINNALCRWEISKTQVRNLFGRQAIPMVWDYAENNVFNSAAGDYLVSLESIVRVIERSLGACLPGYAEQVDAARLEPLAKTLSTDPPYYDNVGYADLSDFFYVWMRKSLRDVYPDIFGTMLVPKEPELIASPYRHGSKEAANQHFESGMEQTFGNIRRFISHDYPLTVYYAFKQQDAEAVADDGPHPKSLPQNEGGTSPLTSQLGEGSGMGTSPLPSSWGKGPGDGGNKARTSTGWETMLTSLIDSGFSIDGTWPMRTELSNRMVGMGTNALASSIVLVCRPRLDDAPTTSRRAFLDALRRELPAALLAMQTGNIAPVDLAQASIGPGMAIYSRYSQVLEADGSPMSVRTALGLINAALDEYLAEQDGNIDPDTRFAVAWFEQFGYNDGEFGIADVLARAKNTSVGGVETAGVVTSGRGRVRLIHWKEYDPANSPQARDGGWNPQQDKRPTIWEATHHLIERLHTHGETGSAALMTKMPSDMAAEARQLAYRLYSICERKGWADHARDYNALVISWSEIGSEATRLRDATQRGEATTQGRLFED